MSKITQYTGLSSVQTDDVLPIVDVHDTTMASSGTTKKVTTAALLAVQQPGVNPGFPIMLAPVNWALANTDTGIGQKPLTSYTYNNGTSGVGATVTHNVNGVLSIDGGSPSVGDRVLVSDPYAGGTGAPPHPDGIYTVTSAGSVSTPWVLTRDTDNNTAALLGRYWAVTITSGTIWGSGFAQVWCLDTGGAVPPFVVGTSFIGFALSAYASNAMYGGSTAYSGGSAAIGPDATAIGVNSLAIGNTSTANAVYATTLGPYSVSNAEFGVACGYSTYVNGIGAHANGCDSNAYGPGMIAEASGRNNVHGDGQGTTQYLVNTTSDATPTALLGVLGKSLKYLDYQGNADFSKTMLVNITVVARRTDTPGTDSVWTAQGVLRGNGSSAYTWIGGSPPTFSVVAQDAGASTWALAVSVSSNTLTLNATGQVGKTIDWTAKILAVETV